MPENWLDFFNYDPTPYPIRVDPPSNPYDNLVFTDLYEPEYIDDSPYSSMLGGGGFPTSFTGTKDVFGEIFRTLEEPGNIAVAAYSGLPFTDPTFEVPSAERLAGGSLRDLAEQGYLNTLTGGLFPAGVKVENPYALAAIEKIGGTALGELMDPTNIPGALVGAGGLVGRGASALDKVFAGMGAVTGLGEGLPTIASAGSNIWEKGLTPENFGQLLEGSIGAGFGGLSAAGLGSNPQINAPKVDPGYLNPFGLDLSLPENYKQPIPETNVEFEYDDSNVRFNEEPVSLENQQLTPQQLYRIEQLTSPTSDYKAFLDYINPMRNESGVLDFTPREVSPIDVSDSIVVEDLPNVSDPIVQAEPIVETSPVDVTETIQIEDPKAELSNFVKEMKEKYEGNWRKKLNTDEKGLFDQLQLDVQRGPESQALTVKESAIEPEIINPQKQLLSLGESKSLNTDTNLLERVKQLRIERGLSLKEARDIAVAEQEGKLIEGQLVQPPAPVKPTNILPPAPPEIKVDDPDKPTPIELAPLGKFERAAYSQERNIAKASPEIGQAEKDYRQYHEVNASREIGKIEEAIQGVSKASENRIIRFLDGEQIVLSPQEASVASKLRQVTEGVAKAAGDEGVLGGYRKDYFTHINENLEPGKATTYYGPEGKDKPYGPLEKKRTKDDKNIIRSFDVIKQYVDKAYRRVGEAKFLGTKLEKVTGTGDVETVNYVKNYIDQITNRKKPAGPVSRALTGLRHVTALSHLGLTSILQVGQGVHTTAIVGLRNSARAAIKTLLSYKKSDLEALKGGALYPSLSHEVGIAVGNKGYMHGVPTVDRAMRVHAFVAGRMLVEDARRGNTYAKRIMDELGIKDLNDPTSVALAGKLISDKTQLRSDPAHLPAWFKTDAGKMATQYLNFAYANTKFVTDMFRKPWQNKGQIFRFALAGGTILGGGVNNVRAIIRSLVDSKDEDDDILVRIWDSLKGDEDFDEKTLDQKIKAVTRSKRIGWNSPGWRAMQNLASIGAGTIFQTLAESVVNGRYRDLPIGPSGGFLFDFLESGYKDVAKSIKEGEPTARKLGRTALSALPVYGRKVADYLLPEESRKGRYRRSKSR